MFVIISLINYTDMQKNGTDESMIYVTDEDEDM